MHLCQLKEDGSTGSNGSSWTDLRDGKDGWWLHTSLDGGYFHTLAGRWLRCDGRTTLATLSAANLSSKRIADPLNIPGER